jgi:flavin-dependent dehydrogenase
MEKKKFDVIIIGGGPSGSISAHWASNIGLKVCIIDKHFFPRDKVCGDCIPPMAFQIMKELNISYSELRMKSMNEINCVSFKSENQKTKINTKNSDFFNIKRNEFDFLLWKSIPNNVIKYEGYSIVSFHFELMKNYYCIKIGNGKKSYMIKAKYIIGADGANSWIRKKSGLFDKFNISLTKAKRVYAISHETKFINSLNYGSNSLSYVWEIPLNNNQVNIGVYFNSPNSILNSSNNDRQTLSEFGTNNKLILDWNTYKGAPIPTVNENENKFANKGVFLIGDAAGLSDPIFGHGIDIGMLSGKMVAICIGKYHKSFNLFKKIKISRLYNKIIMNEIVSKFNNLKTYQNLNELNLDDMIEVILNNPIINSPIQHGKRYKK